MSYWVYVIRSKTTNKRYTGHTNNLERRLKEHNSAKSHNSLYTKKNKGPWEFIYQEKLNTRKEAIKKEALLKTGKGRRFLNGITPR